MKIRFGNLLLGFGKLLSKRRLLLILSILLLLLAIVCLSSWLKDSFIWWGSININGQLNISNDVVDVSKTQGAQNAIKSTGVYNLLYNNSSVNQSGNISYDYLAAFQQDNHLNLDKLIINIPILQLKSEAEVTALIKSLSDLENMGVKIHGVQFDDLRDAYDKHIPAEQFRLFITQLKERYPKIRIIGVFYYQDFLEYELLEQRQSKDTADLQQFKDLQKKYAALQPLLDEVSVWLWQPTSADTLASALKLSKRVLPGKSYNLGIYLHDYANNKPIDANQLKEYLRFSLTYKLTGRVNNIYLLSTYWYSHEDYQIQKKVVDRVFGGIIINPLGAL